MEHSRRGYDAESGSYSNPGARALDAVLPTDHFISHLPCVGLCMRLGRSRSHVTDTGFPEVFLFNAGVRFTQGEEI